MLIGGLRAQESTQPSPATDKHGHVWKTAKVLDASAAKSYVEAGDRTGATATLTIRDTQLLLVSDEFAYVVNDTRTSNKLPLHQGAIGDAGAIAHAIGGRHHGCRFIVGDDVKFYQAKDAINVIDADGKECKTEVFKQERLKKAAPPAESTATSK